MFTGCIVDYIADPFTRSVVDQDDEIEKERREAEEQEAKKEEKQTEVEQTEAAEEVTEESAVSKEKRSFPDEPVTYYFEINECPITLTVDFKTAQITGLAKNPPYDDVIFTDGKIDLDTLEINTSAPQVTDEDSSGNITETTVLTITGKISDDFSTLSGEISNSAGASEEFTATR